VAQRDVGEEGVAGSSDAQTPKSNKIGICSLEQDTPIVIALKIGEGGVIDDSAARESD
jgi:hypothetical protein